MAIADAAQPVARNPFLAQLADRTGWIFAAIAVIIPNIPFLALSIFVCPNRVMSIALYVFVALAARSLAVWLSIALLAAVVFFDVVQVISGVFDLSPLMIVDSLKYAVAFDIFASPAYLIVVALLTATTALTGYLIARYRDAIRTAPLLPALLCAFAVFIFDYAANARTQKALGFLLKTQVEFDSAIGQSGLTPPTVANKGHNMLFVMVEGMGAFADPKHRALLTDRLEKAGLDDRYTVSHGLNTYVGSTTGAESRELCGRWGDHRDYLDGAAHPECLPAQLAERGYDTAAFHAFTGEFFERSLWYPKIGFKHASFREQLDASPMPRSKVSCGLTFTGLCDLDVANHVEKYLAERTDKPRFAYWLTLNTHMPIAPDEGTDRLSCPDGGPFGDRTVCDMTEMWIDVLDRVAQMAANPDLAGTDIIVVGDHHPPIWTRHGRSLFAPGSVAWMALKAKDPAPVRHASR
ncbi:MAG: hypothetical protein C0606_12280 [Hyphomicrobiales bacterium]|nr:MAG: hypothetical protein C0606_12280 [Hyphomicrobiales bacterium]